MRSSSGIGILNYSIIFFGSLSYSAANQGTDFSKEVKCYVKSEYNTLKDYTLFIYADGKLVKSGDALTNGAYAAISRISPFSRLYITGSEINFIPQLSIYMVDNVGD